MEPVQRSPRQNVLIFLRGMAMGAADVVPGVSGGTVAFITGIYAELLNSIRAVRPQALQVLFRDGPAAAWAYLNGTFLVVLASGILVSVVTLARVISWLLENRPIQLWSFFFGLIIYSAWMVSRDIRDRSPVVWGVLLLGTVVAWSISMAVPQTAPLNNLTLFLSGAVAICAMILPGISGSFILVLLGMYAHVIQAIVTIDLATLVVFAGGCLVGLLTFSHLLGWLLERYESLVLALLTGFMLGSLNRVWPWKHTLETYTDRHGDVVPLVQENVLPQHWEQLLGVDSQWQVALLCAAAGFLLVWSVAALAARSAEIRP